MTLANPSGNEIAYHEAMERTIVFSEGRMIAYDAATGNTGVNSVTFTVIARQK